ncbi:YpjP family protein [Bacillus testis]|uniref:YpjP family protein n=1 Tax=Bacillus testis TaxID=1622072 RepID=UPI00067F037D|nr:YpjP family protein [Bacillus testis]
MNVPKWMKKSLVILVSILTLGMVSPDDFQWQDDAAAHKPDKKSLQAEEEKAGSYSFQNSLEEQEPECDREQLAQEFIRVAEESSYAKFGERIKPRIEDEFMEVILPQMEKAITSYIEACPEEDLSNLAISEKPSSGYGEKIFNVYNQQTGKDVIRFHVRRENPPQQGYWFNFHYHTDQDQFITHHELGTIYWDKNTPPKWSTLN